MPFHGPQSIRLPEPPPEPVDDDREALAVAVEANDDPASWTDEELKQGLIRLIRIESRRHRTGDA